MHRLFLQEQASWGEKPNYACVLIHVDTILLVSYLHATDPLFFPTKPFVPKDRSTVSSSQDGSPVLHQSEIFFELFVAFSSTCYFFLGGLGVGGREGKVVLLTKLEIKTWYLTVPQLCDLTHYHLAASSISASSVSCR